MSNDYRTLIMDSQMLSMFQECPEKFNLYFNMLLRQIYTPEPLTKGDVLHTGLEAYYRHLMIGLKEGKERTILHSEGAEIAEVEARAKAALVDIDLGSAEEVIYQVGEYLKFYKDDDIIPIAVEEPFVKAIYDDPEQKIRILYAGKIDLVATASRYQWEPVPFDNKSSQRNITPSGRSNQFFGYVDAIDSSILVVNRIGFQKTLSPAERFKRHTISYPREYRERWILNTIKWGLKMLNAIETGEYLENLTSCDKFSGCMFKAICESSTPEAKEWKIQSEYITGEKWDVTKVLGIKDAGEKVYSATTEPFESSSPDAISTND